MILSLLINPLSLYGEMNLTALSEMAGLFGMGSRKDAREMHRGDRKDAGDAG